MSVAARLLVLGVALLIVLLVFRLLARRKLRSKYALLWLVIAVSSVTFASYPPMIDHVAEWIGVHDAPAMLLTAACVVLLLIAVQYSWELSRLEVRSRRLAEEVALLRLRLERLETGDAVPHPWKDDEACE